MDIAILLYERLTALDAIGPYEVLSRLPEATVQFVAKEVGPKRTDTGALSLVADHSFADVPCPHILVVPGGGSGTMAAARDEETLAWVRKAHESSRWTTSVCTGALILGAAGLLKGLKATTHWYASGLLQSFGAEFSSERFIRQGKIITAAGVSAGIDMALHLAGEIAGKEAAQVIQLALEYDPRPPFDSGSVEKAPAEILEAAREEFNRQVAAGV